MAGQARLPPFFVKRAEAGYTVVTEPPKLDLETYIANYTGRTRLDRLFLVGRTSVNLSMEALKAAVVEAKQGKDTAIYLDIIDTISQIAPDDPDAVPDKAWIDRMEHQVKLETDKLEHELKGYKNNLIKESIRMGNEDLGSHYQSTGELSNAFKAYARMRDFCTSPKHVTEMCLKLVIVSIEQANWMVVQSNTLKIQSLQLKPEDKTEVAPKLSAAQGLAQMSTGNYLDAALNFLRTDFSLGNSFNQVLTPNDVTVYGGLCALASMDRAQLQARVLENLSFRNFLELEPHIRRAITFFCNSKYSQCLEILEAYKPDYLLDLHLQRHLPHLYHGVRSKSVVQYFIPFSCVTLENMAKAFATNEEAIEEELVGMIERGTLEARIDTQSRLVTAKQLNIRTAVHHDALAMAQQYEIAARSRLTRMNIMTAGLEVKAPKPVPAFTAEHTSNGLGSAKGPGLRSSAGRF